MTKLSDTQAIILSAAAQRPEHIALPLPESLRGGAAAKVVADRRTGRILGAHLLGPQASTLIQPLIQAMSFSLPVDQMARGQYWIHPALPEVVENALLGLLQATVPAELGR